MLPPPIVFVDIDTQCDFLEPWGSLYIAGSEVIRPNLARLTNHARQVGIPVIATACAHELDEPDPEPFPPHCLIGTPGADRIDETQWTDGLVLEPEAAFDPPDAPPPHLTIKKRRYDLFSHPAADRIISYYARMNPTFVVYGVATDYCVACAVRGLRHRGHRVALVTDAIDAVDRASVAELLTEFVHLGVEQITTSEVCAEGDPPA